MHKSNKHNGIANLFNFYFKSLRQKTFLWGFGVLGLGFRV